jgi:DnaJ-class molecular chaperone
MLRVRYRRVPLFLTSYRYNHYKTLGVDRHATQEELKKAHKVLAFSIHLLYNCQ